MRGILGSGAYLPYRRLDRSQITAFVGSGGGKGTRTVSSYDEDTTTMGVEAARLALRSTPGIAPDVLAFATCAPAYADRTNATAIQAALRLDTDMLAVDYGAAVRSGSGALLQATPPPRCSSAMPAPAHRSSPSSWAARARPASSSTAGGRRERSARSSGRTGSASWSTCHSASGRGTGR
jgi:hydroxymethylglutaryl-CoA synthase